MVLGAATLETTVYKRGVVLAIIDLEAHGVDHIVLYEQLDGTLRSIIGSFDAGPFQTSYQALQWMLRTLEGQSTLYSC